MHWAIGILSEWNRQFQVWLYGQRDRKTICWPQLNRYWWMFRKINPCAGPFDLSQNQICIFMCDCMTNEFERNNILYRGHTNKFPSVSSSCIRQYSRSVRFAPSLIIWLSSSSFAFFDSLLWSSWDARLRLA